MADKNAMKNKSAMRNKSKVKNKDIAKNKAAGKKKYAVDKTMKQEGKHKASVINVVRANIIAMSFSVIRK